MYRESWSSPFGWLRLPNTGFYDISLSTCTRILCFLWELMKVDLLLCESVKVYCVWGNQRKFIVFLELCFGVSESILCCLGISESTVRCVFWESVKVNCVFGESLKVYCVFWESVKVNCVFGESIKVYCVLGNH